MRPFIEAIGLCTDTYVICYPNAGTKKYFISVMIFVLFFIARVRSTREGNVFTLSVHQGGSTQFTGSWSLVPGPFRESRGYLTGLWSQGREDQERGPTQPEKYPPPPLLAPTRTADPPPPLSPRQDHGQDTPRAVRILRSRRRTVLFSVFMNTS